MHASLVLLGRSTAGQNIPLMRASRGQTALAVSLNQKLRPRRRTAFAARQGNATLSCNSNPKHPPKQPIVSAPRVQPAPQASTLPKFQPRPRIGAVLRATIRKENGRMARTNQAAKPCLRVASTKGFPMKAVLLKTLHAKRVRMATNSLQAATNCRNATRQPQRRQ